MRYAVGRRSLRHAVAVSLVAALLGFGLFVWRIPILRALGSVLVAEDPLGRADVIVIAVDVGAAGLIEAADLIHAGVAQRVAVFETPPDASDQELSRRGVSSESPAEWSRRLLSAMGVKNVETISSLVSGTGEESSILARWCAERRFQAVVVVTTPDHSRRVRRVMSRAFQGAGRVFVRPAPLSAFKPDSWWRTRGGRRTGIIELEKLFLDITQHPFS